MTCDPYPEGGPVECAGIDEAHFPGESGCVRIGTECPEGDWATNLPSNRKIIYVKAGASAGENPDGSQLTPFESISEAIADVSTDAIIALSKGTFDEAVELPRGIVMWGACVSETIVTSSITSENEAVITLRYQNTGIQNLQITAYSDENWIGGEINLSNGIISYNELCGINVQTEEQDLDYLTQNAIYFENNHNNLDTNELPTPNIELNE